jgi:hypothetical protein
MEDLSLHYCNHYALLTPLSLPLNNLSTMAPRNVKKVMTLPINVIFSHLQVSVFDASRIAMHAAYKFKGYLTTGFSLPRSEKEQSVGLAVRRY